MIEIPYGTLHNLCRKTDLYEYLVYGKKYTGMRVDSSAQPLDLSLEDDT